MTVIRKGILVLLLLCMAAQGKESKNAKQEKDDGKSDMAAKFLFNKYSTVTWTFLSSFTSIIPYTCASVVNAAPCMGRRIRRSRKVSEFLDKEASLDGSIDDDGISKKDEPFTNQAKFFFRLWRTVSTTATITTFSTNRSVTVSLSVACTVGGEVYNLCQ